MDTVIGNAWASCCTCEVPLFFKHQSPLQQYLARKEKISSHNTHSFKEVFTSLVTIIREEKMLDLTSKGMAILGKSLSSALNTRGLHVMQIPSAIYAQALYSREIEALVRACNKIFHEKERQNQREKDAARHQWFLPKSSYAIYKSLQVPPQQEIIAGGEISTRINKYIESEYLFDSNNVDVCILKNNPCPAASNLRVALKVDSFHKASLWNLVLDQFERLGQQPVNHRKNHIKKGSSFNPSSSYPIVASNQEMSSKAIKKMDKRKKFIHRVFSILIIIFLALTKNALQN